MKRIDCFLYGLGAFALILGLAGCFDTLSPDMNRNSPDGMGAVRIQLGAAGRTLLPGSITESVFSSYTLVFTKTPGAGSVPVEKSLDSLKGDILLAEGTYRLTLTAYRGTNETKVKAAGGTAEVRVTPGKTVSIPVPLVFEIHNGTGTLGYAISNTSSFTIQEARITLTGLSAGASYPVITILPGAYTGNKTDVPAGYYLLMVSLKAEGKEAIWSEVAQIYPGQTTVLTHGFAPGDFFDPLNKIWLVGLPNWTAFPRGTPMTAEGDQTFTWKGEIAANTTFRFSLTDTSGWSSDHNNQWSGDWLAPGEGRVELVPGVSYDMNLVTHYTGTGTDRVWKIGADGFYVITMNPYTKKLQVTQPVMVEGVIITGPSSVKQGSGDNQFTAMVTGYNVASSQGLTWEVAGKKSGTSISSSGLLTVAGDETLGGSLSITAISTADPRKRGTTRVMVSAVNAIKLSKVGKPELSNLGVATWNGISEDGEVSKYRVKLYKSGTAIETQEVNRGEAYSVNFLDKMRTAGFDSYTLRVTALGNGTTHTDSDESDPSDPQTVTQRSQVLNTWWHEHSKARWVNPDAGGDYRVQLYRNGTALGSSIPVTRQSTTNPGNPAETVTDYDFTVDKAGAGVGFYTFKVIPKGDGKLILDAAESPSSGTSGYSPFGDSRVWTIAYGNRHYVAGGEKGKIAYSSDCEHWTLSAQTIFTDSDTIRGIVYGNNRFVAVGYGGKAAYSDDGGKTWTPVSSGFGSTSILSVAYGNGKFLAGGDGGNVWYSTDGIAWNPVTGWNNTATILDGQAVLGIAFGNNMFVAVGNKGMIAYSSKGDQEWKWSHHLSGEKPGGADNRQGIKSIAFSNGIFVVVKENDTWLAYSGNPGAGQDGAASERWNWKEHQVDRGIEAAAGGNNKFLAVGAGGKVSISSNGDAWTALTLGEGTGHTQFKGDENITAVGYGNGKFILIAANKLAIIPE